MKGDGGEDKETRDTARDGETGERRAAAERINVLISRVQRRFKNLIKRRVVVMSRTSG